MTDSDLDIDVDPALDAHLRRTLREIAATVDAGSPADPNVVRLVPTSPPSTLRHRRWVAAAAVAGLASGAALMAVANRDDEPNASPVTSTIPTDESQELARQCVDSAVGPADEPHAPPNVPTLSASGIRVFEMSTGGRTVLVTDAHAFALCEFGDASSLGSSFGPLTVGPPERADVAGVTWTWGSRGNSDFIEVLGRAGPDVASVALEVDDGLVAGTIVDGWLLVRATDIGNMSEAGASGAYRLHWTADDGTEQGARLDQLDAPDPIELCASDPDCLRTQMVTLRSEARQSELTAQSEILDDLVVTEAERMGTTEAFAECVNSGGFDVTATVNSDASVTTSGADLQPESENYQAVSDLQHRCRDEHMDLVDQAWNLLEAAERIAEG